VPLARLCPGCGRVVTGGRARCPDCARADNQRRGARNVEHGTNTQRWRKLRAHVIARDRCCVRCGSSEDLTVHLDPVLAGDHRHATSVDAITLCRGCHGAVDARRASRPRFFENGAPATPRQLDSHFGDFSSDRAV
jgi:hypothetical protein